MRAHSDSALVEQVRSALGEPAAGITSWQPDPVCLTALDEYTLLAVRCGAAAGLSNAGIAARISDIIDDLWPDPLRAGRDPDPALAGCFASLDPPPAYLDADRWRAAQAAAALARCCAGIGEPARQIVARLSSLATIPGWPDPDGIAGIVAGAVEEMQS